MTVLMNNFAISIFKHFNLFGQIPVKYPVKIPKTNSNNLQPAKTPYQKNGVKSPFPQLNKNFSKFYFAFKSRHSDQSKMPLKLFAVSTAFLFYQVNFVMYVSLLN